MNTTRKVTWYLRALAEYDALVQQQRDDPALTDSPQHRLALHEARLAMYAALHSLTGGQLAEARRLAAPPKESRDP
jgi:hypothetical protein